MLGTIQSPNVVLIWHGICYSRRSRIGENADLSKCRRVVIDCVRMERKEIEETGEWNLEGLFLRLGHPMREFKVKRVILNTIEVLSTALQNRQLLHADW